MVYIDTVGRGYAKVTRLYQLEGEELNKTAKELIDGMPLRFGGYGHRVGADRLEVTEYID